MKAIHWYVSGVAVAALAAALAQDWHGLFDYPTELLVGLAVLTALGVFSEGSALKLQLSRGTATSSVTFLPLLACVALFGPAASVLFFGITGVIAEFLIRRKDAVRAAFNSAQYVLATAVGGWFFSALGGYPVALAAAQDPARPFDAQVLAFAGFGVAFLVTNNLLVFLAISLSSANRFTSVFAALVRRQAVSLVHDFFIAPLGLLIALLYFHLGLLGFVIGLFPLVFVRHSYIAKFRLEQANHDLLKALVMAIETRDKYTSGHSLRVQKLSERIGGALGLSSRHLEDLSTAALLHDVGKIEVGYEDILQKPGKLTDEEHRMMQSHVTRGVEILRAMSSLKPRVIEAVQFHHEAWDGSGYPHGVAGEDIPLYARVIAVSDAVDAMLSDRPYRKALSTAAVKDQLITFKGIQFDPKVVERVLALNIIDGHVEEIRLSRTLKAADADSPAVRLPVDGESRREMSVGQEH